MIHKNSQMAFTPVITTWFIPGTGSISHHLCIHHWTVYFIVNTQKPSNSLHFRYNCLVYNGHASISYILCSPVITRPLITGYILFCHIECSLVITRPFILGIVLYLQSCFKITRPDITRLVISGVLSYWSCDLYARYKLHRYTGHACYIHTILPWTYQTQYN